RVVDEGLLARRHAHEVDAGALESDAARQLRAVHLRLRIPRVGEFLRGRGDVGRTHDVQAGLVHARNLTTFAGRCALAFALGPGAGTHQRARDTAPAAVEDVAPGRVRAGLHVEQPQHRVEQVVV